MAIVVEYRFDPRIPRPGNDPLRNQNLGAGPNAIAVSAAFGAGTAWITIKLDSLTGAPANAALVAGFDWTNYGNVRPPILFTYRIGPFGSNPSLHDIASAQAPTYIPAYDPVIQGLSNDLAVEPASSGLRIAIYVT